MVNLHKNKLRKELLLARAEHDEYEHITQNENLAKKVKLLLDNLYLRFRKKRADYSLGLYWPLKGEPDLFKLAISSNLPVGLPKICGNSMKMVHYKVGSKMEKSNFGELYQPAEGEEIIPKVILIPGLAFSIKGYRLGFGKGHYDRYIAKINQNSEIITIGVCFHDKLFEYLPYHDNDIRLDYIVTDQTLIRL